MRTFLILVAFAAGFFLGRLSVAPQLPPQGQVTEETSVEGRESGEREAEPPTDVSPAVSVPVERLSQAQQSMLRSFGIDPSTITVTGVMIACAKEKVGTARYEEILQGSMPSVSEGLLLLSCYKQ